MSGAKFGQLTKKQIALVPACSAIKTQQRKTNYDSILLLETIFIKHSNANSWDLGYKIINDEFPSFYV